MNREIAGTDGRVRATPGVRDRRVRATKVRLYIVGWTVDYDIGISWSYSLFVSFEQMPLSKKLILKESLVSFSWSIH